MTENAPEPDYAFWNIPESSFTITYSLGLFHEIDFHVNEGYRRIPHGGIEIGGVLFGHMEGNSIRIEAFRSIECEHGLGPSFVLSERDLRALRRQLSDTKTDPELARFEVVGWFISHTRSALRMNDREAALFDELFPGTGRLTLLVKPERFQPTRFSFLVRNTDGTVPRDAMQHAIILPLPGRATRSGSGPVPSIPAPEIAAAPVRPPTPMPTEPIAPPAPPRHQPVSESAAETVELKTAPVSPEPPPISSPTSPVAHEPEPTPEPLAPPPSPQVAQPQAASDALAFPGQPAGSVEKPEREQVASPFSQTASAGPFSPPEALPSSDEIRRRRFESLQTTDVRLPLVPAMHQIEKRARRSNLHLVLILLFAALLGCGVGYWAYLQLPPATIAVDMQNDRSAVSISWPPEQTRDAVYAALRIDDGQQIPLTPDQKVAGRATLTPSSDNVKIELIARHWMRESRGIIRYVKAQSAQVQPVSSR
jgi:hypothetical protein